MPSMLVTGASRGLGLEMVRQFVGDGWRIYACCRTPDTAADLAALAAQSDGAITLHTLDVSKPAQIAALADEFRGTPIDMLVNNAGLLGCTIDDQAPATFGTIDYEAWLEVHEINTMAPLRVTEAFVDHVARSDMKLLFFMSTHMGSITDLADGGSVLLPVEQGGAQSAGQGALHRSRVARGAHDRGPSRLGGHRHGRAPGAGQQGGQHRRHPPGGGGLRRWPDRPLLPVRRQGAALVAARAQESETREYEAMAVDLAQAAKQKKIRYFLISFVDLFGVLRAKLVPAEAIAGMQADGAGFAAFAAWLDSNPAEPDMLVKPDPASLIQLPWKPEVGWLAGDCWMNGEPMPDTPRLKLKSKLDEAKKKGYRVKTGVEAEYFIVSADGTAISDPLDTQAKPCYDQAALMRRYDVVSEICDAMLSLGWGPYQNDHEDANGQFEMNWDYDDALVTADRHVFFKYMVKSLAETHGLQGDVHAKTLLQSDRQRLPRPCLGLEQFRQEEPLPRCQGRARDLSSSAISFLGGIIHRAPALCAIWNPTVNSYKRINAPVTLSGSTWSPNLVAYGGNNRSTMVRIPDAGRFELRLMDGAANPYLLQAGVVVAGLDGIENERDPGQRTDLNLYAEGHKLRGARKLPLNLLDALRLFEKDKVVRAGFGESFVKSYVKLKTSEWNAYAGTISDWERSNTLDC